MVSSFIKVTTLLNNDRAFYKNAFKNTKGQNSFLNTNHEKAVNLIKSMVKDKCEEYDKEIDFYIDMYIRGTTYSFQDWIINDQDYTPEELATYMCNAMPEKLKKYMA